MTHVHLSLGPDSADFPFPLLLLHGGHHRGQDELHRLVCSWRGWRRTSVPALHPELGKCSQYTAFAYPSSLLAIQHRPELQLHWGEDAMRARDKAFLEYEAARAALSARFQLSTPAELTGDRRPMPHQIEAIVAAKHMRWRCFIADDMGLGKTATSLWCTRSSGFQRALVLSPVSVKRNWIREAQLALGDEWRTVLIDGTQRQRADQFVEITRLLRKEGQRALAVINYDLLRTLSDEQMRTLHAFVAACMLICDESHALKGRQAERTQLSGSLSKASRGCLMLTGTPVRNTVADLYSQITLMRPETWTSYTDFAKRHLVVKRTQFGKKLVEDVVRGKDLDELNIVVNSLQIRRKKEDVLSLPPKTRTYPELELCDVTQSIYDAMKDFAKIKLFELGEMNVFDPRAASAVEAAMRCEQIAQGFLGGIPDPVLDHVAKSCWTHGQLIPGRPKELIFPLAPKIRWLCDTIEDIRLQGGKPVVFSRFNAPMVWLHQHLLQSEVRVSRLHGALSSTQKDDEIAKFQKGATEVFLCQVKMAEGFNLVQSQDILFLGRDWSPAVNWQAEDRCHRIGQKGTVNIQIPIVVRTIETTIDRRLIAKDADAQQALRTMTAQQLGDSL